MECFEEILTLAIFDKSCTINIIQKILSKHWVLYMPGFKYSKIICQGLDVPRYYLGTINMADVRDNTINDANNDNIY